MTKLLTFPISSGTAASSMQAPTLSRHESYGVTLLGDFARPGGVTLAFTERTGGRSLSPFASLNLGDACGDEPEVVNANRRLALEALGCEDYANKLINPHQVHGDHLVVLSEKDNEAWSAAFAEARAGADGVICTAPNVPVLLCFADCVPVILVCSGGFAVVHSGWRGSIARISQKAVSVLCAKTGVCPREINAYVGPHIGRMDYEVSADLAKRFIGEFGEAAAADVRHLDLGFAVRAALLDGGVIPERIVSVEESTASTTGRFFSYRAEHGHCGRHGALAFMAAE